MVLVGILLVAVASTITLGAVATDSTFTRSMFDNGADSPTTSGNEGTADGGAGPANEENSTTSPSSPAESDPESSDDQSSQNNPSDNQSSDDQSSDDQPSDNQSSDDQSSDDEAENKSGANFVPGVRNFNISTEVFDESSLDVEDGYITPGEHRLLRFDMIIYNLGDEDAELGRPANNQDLYVHSDSHGHSHLKDFNQYRIFDESGNEMDVGKKQTFCLRDSFQVRSSANSSAQFDCSYQGISAGWADVYDSTLSGQYLVIDDLPDGNYTLQATTNAAGAVDETCAGDNTVRVDLRIRDDTVTVHTPRSYYEQGPTC